MSLTRTSTIFSVYLNRQSPQKLETGCGGFQWVHPKQAAVVEGERVRASKSNIEIDRKEVWRQISNYLDDELPSDLRATMAAHFRECAHCTAVLDGARKVV